METQMGGIESYNIPGGARLESSPAVMLGSQDLLNMNLMALAAIQLRAAGKVPQYNPLTEITTYR